MRNDTRNWAPLAPEEWAITAPGVTVQKITLERQTLVSGVRALTHFDALVGPAIGWPECAQGPSYAAALRRDRVLIVDAPTLADGWHAEAQLAVSDMSGGYSVFELQGPGALDVLKRGTEISPEIPSKSAVRRFAGLEVVLYRYGAPDCVRLHVDRARAQSLQDLLASYLKKMA